MMKRQIYTCLLMLLMLSTAAFAQKKGTPEYNAQLRATIVAMDSVLKYSTKIPPEILMKFADEQCAKFKNDPDLMSAIADLFFTSYNNEIFSNERYTKLKQMYPNYIDAYLNEANLFHSRAWIDAPSYEIKFLQSAKNQIDSAKILFPTSPEPYMKWIRMQAPYRNVRMGGYENLTVDSELEELQKKFPQSNGYLETAKYYDKVLSQKRDISLDDKINYIVFAGHFYGKADINTMKQNEIVDYAYILYQINGKEELEKGLEVLDFGIKKYPEYPYNYRFKMWIDGRLNRWDDLVEAGKLFFEKGDTLQKLTDDYRWMGEACYEKKQYQEAINYYNKQNDLGIKDSTQQALYYRNLLDCYNELKQLEPAVETFEKLVSFKKQKGMALNIYDYDKLEKAYKNQVNDSNIVTSKEERIRYFKELISICETEGQLSPLEKGRVYYNRLNYTLRLIGEENGVQDLKNAVVLKAAQELVQAVAELQSSQAEKEKDVNDFYFMLYGYRAVMVHYYLIDNHEEAYKNAEIMLYEMPEAVELIGMDRSTAQAYTELKSVAQQIYDTLRPKFAKKRR